jgi:hypothetical protein
LLVGQPTLARQLRMGVFAALDQRICVFRRKPITHSDPIRSPIPMNPISDSDESDHPVKAVDAAAA